MPKNVLVNSRELRANNRSNIREIYLLKSKIYKKNIDIAYHYKNYIKYKEESISLGNKINILFSFYNNIWGNLVNVKKKYNELLDEYIDELIENDEN